MILALKIIGGIVVLFIVVALVLAFTFFSNPDNYR